MALFSEKYKDIVRVVTIGDSIELCGGTHVKNTSDINKLAIINIESKGSNVYRIEACTNSNIEDILLNTIKPYNDEKIKLLMKAREILEDARNNNIKLEFDIEINNEKPTSYKDIIYNRNELQYIQQEVKDLEKKYKEIKEKEVINNLDIYKENIKEINGVQTLIMKLDNMEMNILKTIADTLINEMKNGFLFFINIKKDNSVNFIAKSSSFVNAGLIVKDASISSEGNGGGSPTFAQGGGKTTAQVEEIIKHIKKVISNHE